MFHRVADVAPCVGTLGPRAVRHRICHMWASPHLPGRISGVRSGGLPIVSFASVCDGSDLHSCSSVLLRFFWSRRTCAHLQEARFGQYPTPPYPAFHPFFPRGAIGYSGIPAFYVLPSPPIRSHSCVRFFRALCEPADCLYICLQGFCRVSWLESAGLLATLIENCRDRFSIDLMTTRAICGVGWRWSTACYGCLDGTNEGGE